ncbi:MAG TPA: hypothetical protein V6D05_13895 [Stenomitos sp.]
MRSSLSRASGLFLCVALAIAPHPAWAAPERADLGQTQSKTTEVRWQPTPKTEIVTDPWQLVGATTRVDRSQPSPATARFQEVRTDLYRQRTTTYPLEAKEQRTKTTTTQNYELKTYAEQSTTSTQLIPVSKVVGEWLSTTKDKPVTTTIQVLSSEPRPVPTQVPVLRMVTSTYSIAPVPIKTTISYTKLVPTSKEETVTKTKTETYTKTERNRYNGHMYDASSGKDLGTVQVWDGEDGLTLNCPDYRLEDVSMRFADSAKQKLTYSLQGWGRVGSEPQIAGNCNVTEENGHQCLEFDGDLRHLAWTHWWGARVKVKLDNKLFYDTSVEATREVTYAEKVTKTVDVQTPATFSIQLETLTNNPTDLMDKQKNQGVFWKHYHARGIDCPYQSTPLGIGKSTVTGNLAARIAGLDSTEKGVFSLSNHHTDVMPTFQDDATPAGIGTKSDQIVDHYETQTVWDSSPHMVSKQVTVQKVVGWTDKGPKFQFTHAHDATVQCNDQYRVWNPNPGIAIHTRAPVFEPVTEKVTSTEWATHSVTVLEPQTVTSTFSVLVASVPGEDVSVSYSPWVATGETRHVGEGSFQDATRSVTVAGPFWVQDLSITANVTIEPMKPQSSTFLSDRSSGSQRQALHGLALRRKLKANEAVASKPRAVQAASSIVQGVTGGRNDAPSQPVEAKSMNVPQGDDPVKKAKDRSDDPGKKAKDRSNNGK